MIRLLLQSLRHYRRRHLSLALGVAVSTAVITGALIVGDSMRYSLERIAARRLGQITHTILAGDRYFTGSLAARLEENLGIPCAPLLLLEGSAAIQGGQYRLPKVQVLGIEENFARATGSINTPSVIPPGQAFISQNVAARLNLRKGDDLLLRIKKSSTVPLNAPFVSDADVIVLLTVTVAGILNEAAMGCFQLQHIQSAPFNVFLSLDFLNEQMESLDKVNHLLLSASNFTRPDVIEEALNQSWIPADINLDIQNNSLQKAWELTSERVFIDPVIRDALDRDPTPKEFILTYFVNRLVSEHGETPYSFVSTLPENELQPGEIVINQWLADDLKVHINDHIQLDYFVIGPLRTLEERSAFFVVKKIVPVSGRWADPHQMPQIPGLSNVGNCSDWETGVPINLEKIREEDEGYWDRYRGTPKAYVAYTEAQRLWQNRFGAVTMIRFSTQNTGRKDVEALIKRRISLFDVGFRVKAVRAEADLAANSGVDFSQLFLGLSFFLVLAGLLLTMLLFSLHTESRMDQIGTLAILGFTRRQIKKIVLLESGAVSVIGAAAGILLAIGYNQAIFSALNNIWSAIVRTQTLATSIQPSTLAIGFSISLVVSLLVIYFSMNRLLRQQAHRLQSGTARFERRWMQWLKKLAMYGSGVVAMLLVSWSVTRGTLQDAGSFLAAGGLLLIGCLLWAHSYLRASPNLSESSRMTLSQLVRQNIRRNRNRSFLVIALFAIGTFIVVATGVHRRDVSSMALEKESGTGGFLFFAESTVPVLRDLNDPAVRFEAGLETDYPIVQLRTFQGDDASCLNLHRISTPSIWGVRPEALSGRFRFVSQTEELDEAHPWLSLREKLDEQTIPAIADQTVIQWGLGLKMGDTLQYLDEHGRPLNLKLIGGLSNSIFQGSVLVDEALFLEHFPGSSGSNIFLVAGDPTESQTIQQEMERSFRDHGWLMVSTAERLAAFNSVENTYLSIFMILGGLGLLLGTIGLGIVLARNLLGRRDELALMASLGFRKAGIQRMIAREHIYLLLLGVGIGTLSSTIAALPAWLNPNLEVSPWSVVLLITALFVIGLGWIFFFAWRFLSVFYVSDESTAGQFMPIRG